MNQNMTFETAMKKLAQIVAKLESGTLSLEESLKLFEEGTALSEHCYKKLAQAEQKIEEIDAMEKSHE
ncbi:MAG: exodeoxyribonuclease VII small subunit [Oscillospiraceae bacterium]|nr:exodeoxyribonuclease VII small subunit [Oscillospiraceae bacterium]